MYLMLLISILYGKSSGLRQSLDRKSCRESDGVVLEFCSAEKNKNVLVM